MIGAVLAKPGFILKKDNSSLIELLASFSILYTSPDFGGDIFASVLPSLKMPKVKTLDYVEKFDEVVAFLLKLSVDVVVTVGGDGIASYLASSIIKQGNKEKEIAILGYPEGTANIGPIVKHGLTKESLKKVRTLDAIEASDGNKVIGYGFNDVVIANSFLGTVNDKTVNLDAATMENQGIPKEVKPCGDITLDSFAIYLNGEKVQPQEGWKNVKQICISTLNTDILRGRAVFGGILASCGYSHPAAVSVMDRIVVDSRPETWNFNGAITTSHISFHEGDVIEIVGLSNIAHAIVDGNPFCIAEGKLILKVKANAVKAIG